MKSVSLTVSDNQNILFWQVYFPVLKKTRTLTNTFVNLWLCEAERQKIVEVHSIWYDKFSYLIIVYIFVYGLRREHAVAQLVEALRHNPEVREFL